MNRCSCGSYAINHHLHGRDGSEPDLCDVCYWKKYAEKYREALEKINEIIYAAGAPVGSVNYFAIREQLCKALKDD